MNFQWKDTDEGDESLPNIQPSTSNEINKKSTDIIKNSHEIDGERNLKQDSDKKKFDGIDERCRGNKQRKGKGNLCHVKYIGYPETDVNIEHSYAKRMRTKCQKESSGRTYFKSGNSLIFYQANVDEVEEIPVDDPTTSTDDVSGSRDNSNNLEVAMEQFKTGDIKLFQCDICKIEFRQKGYMIRHKRDDHTGTKKQYNCPICPYRTNIKSNLKPHLEMHAKIKIFICKK